jgi:hypothetical protein
MKLQPFSPLSRFDCKMLRVAGLAVPREQRDEWNRVWQAELWHVRHRRGEAAGRAVADLSVGLICDALWLRGESWRRMLSGTAALCLGSLAGLLLLSTLLALALNGDWRTLEVNLGQEFRRFLFEAPLVALVNFAIASRISMERSSKTGSNFWLVRQMFLGAKTVLASLLAFVLSADLCVPLHLRLPIFGDVLQTISFTIFALVGLRWVFLDQEQRCKQCLRSLALPARIGRPSRNLLEWNGTELICTRGHGLLSIPEMETSWCESSHWVDLVQKRA